MRHYLFILIHIPWYHIDCFFCCYSLSPVTTESVTCKWYTEPLIVVYLQAMVVCEVETLAMMVVNDLMQHMHNAEWEQC